MSGRLIILPHKTWHVWNREAIAKVRNDERDHAEKTEASAEKQRELDGEARIELLRRRAGTATIEAEGRIGSDTSIVPSVPPVPSNEEEQLGGGFLHGPDGHLNLFADVEHAMGVNAEHERDRLAREALAAKRSGTAACTLTITLLVEPPLRIFFLPFLH